MSLRVHFSLQVADLDRSAAFYTALFGEAPDKRRTDYVRFMPSKTPILLSLIPGGQGIGSGDVEHFGLRYDTPAQVADAVARLGERITQRDTSTRCCYATQDKAWLSDPDGHSWEIYAVTDENAEMDNLRGDQKCCG
ncbi:MAG: VOC family protein [Myxococcota bacterium]